VIVAKPDDCGADTAAAMVTRVKPLPRRAFGAIMKNV
jgi:hypothetical protein